ncbi:MAG: hypothetical protein H6739_08505 [Alphaproteobacteria bacterium]|nr:hypothetical protein [Alphaproteobacteria bacterium]
MTRRFVLAALCATLASTSLPAFAGGLSKAERKALEQAATDAYKGKDIWALKDLPVNTGLTMGIPWVGPIAEATPQGWTIDASTGMSSTMGSAQSVYFSVRPNDKIRFKETEYDDGVLTLTFTGVGNAEGRDTKIKCTGMTEFGQLQASLGELITTTDPVDASWSSEVKAGIYNRKLVNGMSKRQAYLVVGEPTSASVTEEEGKKIETWHPRQDYGMRIGYSMALEATGFPNEIRFEDGVLVGIATTTGGGVSLD